MLAGQVGLLQVDAARRRRVVVRPADVALMSALRLLDVSMSDGLLILGQLLLLLLLHFLLGHGRDGRHHALIAQRCPAQKRMAPSGHTGWQRGFRG